MFYCSGVSAAGNCGAVVADMAWPVASDELSLRSSGRLTQHDRRNSTMTGRWHPAQLQ